MELLHGFSIDALKKRKLNYSSNLNAIQIGWISAPIVEPAYELNPIYLEGTNLIMLLCNKVGVFPQVY